ncbi:ADP-ribose pyrophosphatase YjhB (NUDIX family) [Streptomyces zagrosensis]|uniref:ADP-ribose pyrophosphatase YjhB (NUDIX family) n=2 Tax=Streptomyces zagrosensis TaxID=1042984 RepID=A0A7W9QF26_9ACTN|nr:ADP-ribose pyrophosphatase YjhB (NUDIX family) [Streptomyces zagrosensis]
MSLAEGCSSTLKTSASALLQSQDMKTVLMLQARYGDKKWRLPGGRRTEGETLGQAAERCLLRETGLERHVWQALVLDSRTREAEPTKGEGLHVVFYGGFFTKEKGQPLILPESASDSYGAIALIRYDQLSDHCTPLTMRRVDHARRAQRLRQGIPLLTNGHYE